MSEVGHRSFLEGRTKLIMPRFSTNAQTDTIKKPIGYNGIYSYTVLVILVIHRHHKYSS